MLTTPNSKVDAMQTYKRTTINWAEIEQARPRESAPAEVVWLHQRVSAPATVKAKSNAPASEARPPQRPDGVRIRQAA